MAEILVGLLRWVGIASIGWVGADFLNWLNKRNQRQSQDPVSSYPRSISRIAIMAFVVIMILFFFLFFRNSKKR